ncbi:phospho-sugar mutase [Mumia sp. ZJ1417]|uniref:phospho-sugar mutase n=1 Tax=Mumia sp. ZJ1417 TaxID=2708082 RepID=UPI00141EFB20|nr:phospho-sugar mutase [Mumia sp. ZJ1417]QMW65625.1 phospho-sugar mutase [Mumia sp. ZJ1417]
MTSPDLTPKDLAEAWLAQDPDPQTRDELRVLLDSGDEAELSTRFAGRLVFGTAGLRGPLGAGPTRMNRVVVAQAAAGLAAYLRAHADEAPTLVVGYDARHNSAIFARDTCEIAEAAGVRALLLPEALPTPVLAFAIQHLGASAGVMVTASHNPPQDNGYKVYLGDGSQIVPPADVDIAEAIAAVGPVDSLPRDEAYEVLTDEVREAYVAAVAALPDAGPRELVVAYTPLHGVGLATAAEAVRAAGFEALHVVEEQADPDPDFPTVSFPNPEEPGATDLLLALADHVGADLALANDPDADRCAVAVPTPAGWHQLSGDEVGVLLADFLLRRGVAGTYATTIVSSSLLGRMAEAYGQPYAETLTGFKWIGRVPGLAYGYEEALGYAAAPAIARDKDGISAMVRMLELAAELRVQGQTLRDRLDEIAARFGVHATDQLSVRIDDLTLITQAMARLRAAPPTVLGGYAVEHVDDLEAGSESLPPTDGLRLVLAEGGRVVVRPSGTEPKLKCYLEVVVPADDGVDAARIAAAARLDAIRAHLSTALGL